MRGRRRRRRCVAEGASSVTAPSPPLRFAPLVRPQAGPSPRRRGEAGSRPSPRAKRSRRGVRIRWHTGRARRENPALSPRQRWSTISGPRRRDDGPIRHGKEADDARHAPPLPRRHRRRPRGRSPFSAPAAAADTIPIIVKDTTSFFWQIVLAGARKAGKDLGVNVPELGAQSEADINGQITILENAVSGKPGGDRHRADRVQGARQADRRGREVGQDHRHRLGRGFEGLHLVPDHRQCAGRPGRRRRARRRDQPRSTASPRATWR